MNKKVLKATHAADLPIGDISLPVAVLDDENHTRVISERGVTKALGGKRGGAHWRRMKGKPDGAYLPVYISANNLKPFIDDKLSMALNEPIKYKTKTGGTGYGLRADLLPEICDVWLKARDARVLSSGQHHIAEMADALMRSFAKVGIVALIDEVTGFQEERDRYELNRLLAIYLTEERLKWARFFPDEFYKQIYRLRNWVYPGGVKRTPLIGKITNEIVYEKLPEGVLGKLRELNPVISQTKRRRWKHTQYLSADIGQPDLRDHLLQLIAIMRASSNWNLFKRLFARAFPSGRSQLELPLPEEDNQI
jgi:hypothetical protein